MSGMFVTKSEMRQFVYECQDIAEQNYNQPLDVVRAKVWDEFSERPEFRKMAYETTIHYWEEIQSDLRLVG